MVIEHKTQMNWKFFWVFLLYSSYWAALMAISYLRGSLTIVNLGTSAILLLMAILYWIFGGGLIIAIEKYTFTSINSEDLVPGKMTLLHLILLSVT